MRSPCRVEVFDANSPSRILFFQNERQSLAAIVDGSRSWGNGVEAADLSRSILGALWARAAGWTAAQVERDIEQAALSTPDALRDPHFGWSFSVTALLCTDDLIECVAAGVYRVDVIGSEQPKNLFRPTMLVDHLAAKGEVTPEALASFPHRDICLGPFIGDDDGVRVSTVVHTLASSDVVVVTDAARHNAALDVGAALPTSAKTLAVQAAPSTYPSPVILVRW